MPSNKSVLLFYQINHFKIYSKDFDTIWNEYISSNNDKARCINAIQVDMSASKLLQLIQDRKLADEIFDEFKAEYEMGANIVFIVPVNGSPIGAFLLSKLISH